MLVLVVARIGGYYRVNLSRGVRRLSSVSEGSELECVFEGNRVMVGER